MRPLEFDVSPEQCLSFSSNFNNQPLCANEQNE